MEVRLLLTDPGLTLSLGQSSIWEASGTTTCFVTRTNSDTSQSVVVTLSNSDTSELNIPATITIAAGQTTATFTARGVDDTLLDGTQHVTLTATATLTPIGGGSFVATAERVIDVVDYESLSTLPLSVTQLTSIDSGSVYIQRSNTDLDAAVTVTIENSDPSELFAPTSAVIAAGAKSVRISVHFADNGIPDGTRTVNLTFRADGYRNGGAQITLIEQGTKTLEAAADGSAFNSDADPAFESVDTTSASVRIQPNYRGLFEFNTSVFAGRQVEAVALTLDPYSSRYFTGDVFTFDVYAYAGNGVISTDDALATATKVGGYTVNTTNFFGTSRRQTIALNTAVIQSLLNSSSYIGLVVVYTGGGSEYAVNALESTITSKQSPSLQFFLQNDAPVMASPSYAFSVTENAPLATFVGSVSATDVNAGDVLKYSLLGDEFGVFSINSTTGAITVNSPARLDYELKSRYVLTARATDDGRGILYGEATVIIDLADVIAPQVVKAELGYGTDRWVDASFLAGRTAPWQITKFRFTFSQAVSVDVNDLKIVNSAGATLSFSAFAYDSATFTAVWTLTSPLDANRLAITLDGDATNADNQNPDRNFGVSTNGEYLAGGDHLMSLDVLYGDVNGDGTVNLIDALLQRGRNGTDDIWGDINGDGVVNLVDALLLRGRNGTTLP